MQPKVMNLIVEQLSLLKHQHHELQQSLSHFGASLEKLEILATKDQAAEETSGNPAEAEAHERAAEETSGNTAEETSGNPVEESDENGAEGQPQSGNSNEDVSVNTDALYTNEGIPLLPDPPVDVIDYDVKNTFIECKGNFSPTSVEARYLSAPAPTITRLEDDLAFLEQALAEENHPGEKPAEEEDKPEDEAEDKSAGTSGTKTPRCGQGSDCPGSDTSAPEDSSKNWYHWYNCRWCGTLNAMPSEHKICCWCAFDNSTNGMPYTMPCTNTMEHGNVQGHSGVSLPQPEPKPQANLKGMTRSVWRAVKHATVRVRHVPNKLTRKEIQDAVDEQFNGRYDYMYVPMDYERGLNKGQFFINFINLEAANEFQAAWWGKRLPGATEYKTCEVDNADTKGLQGNLARFITKGPYGQVKYSHPVRTDSRSETRYEPIMWGPGPAGTQWEGGEACWRLLDGNPDLGDREN